MRYLLLTLGMVTAAAAQVQDLKSHMLEHFARATQLQSAVVAGDLTRAGERATWLADHAPPDDLPEGWQPYVQTLQDQATEIQHTQSLVIAAGATADLALACGQCHEGYSVRVWLNTSTEPAEGTTLPRRMARHQWAVDRLWEGLIGPSDDAWFAGAQALAETPLSAKDIGGENHSSADFLGQRVNDLGRQARQTSQGRGRARIFGHLLTTCSQCHGLYRAR